MYHQVQKSGFAAPVQVLMDMGILSKEDYERWRFGNEDIEKAYATHYVSTIKANITES